MSKCPGSHCPSCRNGSGAAWLITAGAAVAALAGLGWLADEALTAIAPWMPVMVGLGLAVMVAALSAVAVGTARQRARLAWLRRGLPRPPHARASVPVRAVQSRPARPLADRQARALPAGSDRLSAAQAVPGQVISRSPAELAPARPRTR